MSGGWEAVAAAGTDPAALARVVALSATTAGRAAVRAAVADDATLLDRGTLLGSDLLPDPTPSQRTTAEAALRTWQRLGIRAAVRGDSTWPARLERIDAPPSWLAWRGPDALPDGPAVAIVGARRATPYGTGVAAWLAEAAGQAGATVVSGGAVGVDAAAHGAALEHGTTVVLGCGHAVDYPRPHARRGGLFERALAGGGAIVSELLPTEQPRPHNVRARNRVVAGLVDVVVVVEGGPTSGSLVTATDAADAGVEVMAVPGDVRAAGSAAPHQLLREGAAACTDPEDLLAALSARLSVAEAAPARGGDDPVDLSVLPAPLATVLREAWPRPLRTDQLADRSGVAIGAVLAAVTRGRISGAVVETAEGVRLTRPPSIGG